MRLSPRDRLRVRRATRRAEPDPSELAGELNIVPFLDVVVNLMLFLLATAAATMAVAQTDAELPSTCRGCDGSVPLHLSVTVTEGAIVVATREGRLAPGCERVAAGPAPTIAGHGFDALGACLAAVHARHPGEDELILTAAPTVRYEALVRAMDAARGDGGRFPRVRLSAGVR